MFPLGSSGPLPRRLRMWYLPHKPRAVFLSRAVLLQVLLSLMLAVASLHRRITSSQTEDPYKQGSHDQQWRRYVWLLKCPVSARFNDRLPYLEYSILQRWARWLGWTALGMNRSRLCVCVLENSSLLRSEFKCNCSKDVCQYMHPLL